MQSGCVALASGLTHLWVLGAGQTIWIADSDSVHAVRSGDEVRGDETAQGGGATEGAGRLQGAS